MEQPPENKSSRPKVDKRMILMPLQAGCLTFAVAGIALLVGYLIDTRLGTFPRWTLIVLIGSAPLTLAGVYLLVRRALIRRRKELESQTKPEDADQA